MKGLLIFGGTTEGRRLANFCEKHSIDVTVSVATDYGDIFIENGHHINVIRGRMDAEDAFNYISNNNIGCVVDATHPYAEEVTKNIKEACTKSSVIYKRLIRKNEDDSDYSDIIVTKASCDEAIEYLHDKTGNILLTTGSKEIALYKELNKSDRVYARILPSEESFKACIDAGINRKNIIAMQGPFSKELNEAILKQYNCQYMLTKESGSAGGYRQKLEACASTGVTAIVISRPNEKNGESFEQICEYLGKKYIENKTQVSIVGIGMGNTDTMTEEAENIIDGADVLIGGERMLKAYENSDKKIYKGYKAEAIADYIASCIPGSNIAVLMSGDVGFYSGTKRLLKVLSNYDVKLYPGISSVVYMAARLTMTWQDMVLCSVHGREQNVISKIKNNNKVFLLSGNYDEIHDICSKLIKYKMDETDIYVGERLSYSDERIWHGNAAEALKEDFDDLAVCVFVNSHCDISVKAPGISDGEFIREKIPMTKEEIRVISISKLRLTENAVVYDIGAGTGSVSVEMARIIENSVVYAIEKNEEAAALIERNCEKFCITNIKIIHGTAPEAMYILPVPTHAFIGGSSGRLKDIIVTLFEMNPNIRIVINAVTLETISEISQLMSNYNSELINVNISRALAAGEHNLMTAGNPVMIAVLWRKD